MVYCGPPPAGLEHDLSLGNPKSGLQDLSVTRVGTIKLPMVLSAY